MKIDFDIKTDAIGDLSPYRVADFLEILLLIKKYDEISKSDVDDILRDWSVYDKNSIPHLEWFRDDPRFAGSTDKEELYVDVVWEHWERRLAIFGEVTPFEKVDSVIRIRSHTRKDRSNYVLLLLCSKLRLVSDRAKREDLANKFEELCCEVLQTDYFPTADIKSFGAKSNHFGKQLRDAVRNLAKWLGEPARESAIEETSDRGDFGLDIVGKLQADRYDAGAVFIVGQCAAREDEWEKKKEEARNILTLIDCYNQPINMVFIPHAYRKTDGRWYKETSARHVSLFDRVRLLT